MKAHAESQITDTDEVIALFESALRDPKHRGTLRTVRGRRVSTAEMLELSSMTTPTGPLHIVALVRVADGERYWSQFYRSGRDALAVWNHLADEAKESGTSK